MPYALPAQIVRTGEERATLIRRTYALLLTGILVTIGAAAFTFSSPAIMNAVAQHPFITMLCVFAPLIAARSAYRSFPVNIGLMYLFNIAMGIFLAPVLFYFAKSQPATLQQAAILTGTTFGVLTIYAFVSRRDFSAWGGFLITGLWVLIATEILGMFFHNPVADLWMSGVAVFIFAGLLVFRTWQIRNVYGPDEYIPAALGIYLSLLNLFINILFLLSGGGRRR